MLSCELLSVSAFASVSVSAAASASESVTETSKRCRMLAMTHVSEAPIAAISRLSCIKVLYSGSAKALSIEALFTIKARPIC